MTTLFDLCQPIFIMFVARKLQNYNKFAKRRLHLKRFCHCTALYNLDSIFVRVVHYYFKTSFCYFGKVCVNFRVHELQVISIFKPEPRIDLQVFLFYTVSQKTRKL